ncbi:MAG: glycosyltransferase family 4 protein [Oribacterium sp.]|nr:glycosyltransferase family 4 protein [Oribacterium sp.]
MNISNYIKRIDRDDVSIHLPPLILADTTEHPEGVLLISHELTLSGAPIQLYMLAKALIDLKYQPIVYSLSEGNLIDDYIKINVPVICGMSPAESAEWVNELVRDFKYIFVNTLPMAPFVRYLSFDTRRIFWWIHESSYLFKDKYCTDIPKSSGLRILAVSEVCSNHIRKYLNLDSTLFNICIEDQKASYKRSSDKTIFLWAGILDYNKAPEILLQAIISLPENYTGKSEFIIVGQTHHNHENEYANLVKEIASKLPNTRFIDTMNHNEFLKLLDTVDSIVVTSKEETMSAVAVEGLMKGKVVVCTEGCGVAKHIETMKNGFVFPVCNSQRLSEILKIIIDNNDNLDFLRLAGRKTYEATFTYDVFKQNLEKLLTKYI